MDRVTYIHLPAGRTPPPLRPEGSYRAVLIIEQEVDEPWRALVSEWLIQTGCLYMMAWGIDCSLWDDSVNHANRAVFRFDHIPDEAFCFTTWHQQEPLSEALWFAAHCAIHPDVDLSGTVLVHIAAEARGPDLLEAFAKAEASAL